MGLINWHLAANLPDRIHDISLSAHDLVCLPANRVRKSSTSVESCATFHETAARAVAQMLCTAFVTLVKYTILLWLPFGSETVSGMAQ